MEPIACIPADRLGGKIMRRILFITALFIFFSAAASFAQISIEADVDKVKMTTDEALTYKMTINSSEKNIPLPKLPKFVGFQAVSQVESSHIAFAEGGTKTVVVYVVVLVPEGIGKFKIEPASIKIKNRTYSSQALEIEVAQGKTKPRPKEELSSPEEAPAETETPQIIL